MNASTVWGRGWLAITIMMVAMILPGQIFAALHVFSLPDGRSLEANIVSYDAKSGKVTLEREDGKRVKVSPDVFVEADQMYIKSWVAANAFLSDSILQVECDDRQVKDWKEKETATVTIMGDQVENLLHNVVKYEEIAYDFTFSNKGTTPISGLTLEYCIYYEQSAMTTNREIPEPERRTLYGKMDLPEIAGKGKVSVSTKEVRIYEDEINPIPRHGGDLRRPGEGEVIGICARLVFKNGDEELVREIRKPDWLPEEEYPWTTTTSSSERPRSRLH